MVEVNVTSWLLEIKTLWTDFVKNNHICAADMVVFIISGDEYINNETAGSLEKLRRKKRIKRFVIVSDSDSVRRYLGVYCEAPYTFVRWNMEQVESIVRLYSIRPFSEQVIFNDMRGMLTVDPYRLTGIGEITSRDILNLCFLDIDDNISESDFRLPEFEQIDWDDGFRKKFRDCSDFGEILEKLISMGVVSSKGRIALFAITDTMRRVAQMLSDFDIEVILDNGNNRQDCDGIPVKTPEDYLLQYREGLCILVTSRHYKRICEQLKVYGYVYGENVFVVHDRYLFDMDFSEITDQVSEELEAGSDLFDHLYRKYPEKRYIIHPASGTGDLYLAYHYLMEMNIDPDDIVYVTASTSCIRLAGVMGLVSERIQSDEIEALVSFVRADDLAKENCVFININHRQIFIDRILGFKGLDFNTVLQKVLYGTEKRTKAGRIPQKKSDDLFEEKGLKKGKTVLLSPFANSSVRIPMDIWEDIVELFMKKGYDVCTNISGSEQPVSGSIGVEVPYSQVLDFVDKAGLFVGARSGLCDILSGTFAHMIILYPDQPVSKFGSFYDFFSLISMGIRKEKILEIECNDPVLLNVIGDYVFSDVDRKD